MSEFADIESAIVGLIQGIEDGGTPVFASVQGVAAADRKSTLEVATRLRKPVALVVLDGRQRLVASEGVLGDPRVTVVIAGAGLRSADGARLGDVDSFGAYDLATRVTSVLDGMVIDGIRRLMGIDEQTVAADERFVVIEQRWVAERPAELAVPTYGGGTITGSDATVSVQLDARRAKAVEFSFPGVDGVFRHSLGASERVIRWTGQLRATTHAGLTTTESAIETLIGDGQPQTMVDAFGRTFERCVAEEFHRRGPRRVHPVSGVIAQNFELAFVQIAG